MTRIKVLALRVPPTADLLWAHGPQMEWGGAAFGVCVHLWRYFVLAIYRG